METKTSILTGTLAKPYMILENELVLDGEGIRSYIPRVRDMAEEEKPREKLIKYGPAVLSLAELLAIIFGVGTRKEEVLSMSQRLLKEYGTKTIVHEKSPKKIAEALGIPLAKACQVVACFELGRRFFKTPQGKPEFLRNAKEVYEYLKDMRDLPKEQLRGIYLDSHYRLIHDEVISIGSVSANLVHPREVFRPAVEHSSSAIILAHNHPSGVAKPSEEDINVTKQLVEAGKILGIHVLDHVIITKNKSVSVNVDYN